MLGFVKYCLKISVIPTLYVLGGMVVVVSLFKSALTGLSLLTFLIPQPNLWHRLYTYPLGDQYIDILYFAVLIGMLLQERGTARVRNGLLIALILVVSYLSLWTSSFTYNLPLPFTGDSWQFKEWKNYAQMISLYFISAAVVKDETHKKRIVLIITVAVLILSVRAYRNFSPSGAFNYDKRVGGPFEAVGLGANHMGAFAVHYGVFIAGLLLVETDAKLRLLYGATILFTLHPLFFSYSRGAYLAALVSVGFLGIVRKRSLLVALAVVLIAWKLILPVTVVERISMTKNQDGTLDHSGGGRMNLWKMGFDLFEKHPVFGSGYGSYGLEYGGRTMADGESLLAGQDVHSLYVKVLCDEGVVGFGLLLLILLKSFASGWSLFRHGSTEFQRGMGLGLATMVLAVVVTNAFGNRWSYFVLQSYFWLIWGCVDRALSSLAEEGGASAADEGRAAALPLQDGAGTRQPGTLIP